MSELVDFLAKVRYFAGMRVSEIEAVASFVFEKEVEKGDVIVWEGDRGDPLYFVAVGAVKCFKTSEEGKEQIVRIILPADSFNDLAAIDGGPNSANAEAMSRVVLYGISKGDLDRAMLDHPLMLLNALKVLSARARYLLGLVEDLSFRHVLNRIAKVLLDHTAGGSDSRPRLTQQDMAAIVGTAREVVGRSLKTLQQEGVIRMDRNRLVIVDREGLRRMAQATN